jgi:hypothetical protein
MSYLFGFKYVRPEASLNGVADAMIEALTIHRHVVITIFVLKVLR